MLNILFLKSLNLICTLFRKTSHEVWINKSGVKMRLEENVKTWKKQIGYLQRPEVTSINPTINRKSSGNRPT